MQFKMRIKNIAAKNIAALVRAFGQHNAGVTAIEYGLIAGLIAVGLVTVLGLVGGSLNNLFSAVSGSVGSA